MSTPARPSRFRIRLAGAVSLFAGLAVLGAGSWLIADAATALARKPAEQRRIDQLTVAAQQDAAPAAQLRAELDRQTAASLARDQRAALLAKFLLAAAILLVAGVKWLIAMRHPQPAPPQRVLQLHARGASAAIASNTPVDTHADPALPTQLPLSSMTSAPKSPALQSEPDAVDLRPVDEIIARVGRQAAAAIPILHEIQAHYRYLPPAALRRVCEQTAITPAQIAGVASFYSQFRRTPVGERVVTVCHGTACHVAGAVPITEELRRRLGIPDGTDTDPARRYTVEQVPCMGCCTLAPVVRIDGVTHGHTRADSVLELVEQQKGREAGVIGPGDSKRRQRSGENRTSQAPANAAIGEIRLGLGSCCIANGSGAVHDALEGALARLDRPVRVKRVGCVGMCHQTPFVEVRTHDLAADSDTAESLAARRDGATLYSRVRPEEVEAIVRRHFPPHGLVGRARFYLSQVTAISRWRSRARRGGESTCACANAQAPTATQPKSSPHTIELRDPPVAAFLGRQVHIATEHCGSLDPLDFDEYVAHGGFAALARVRDTGRDPGAVIDEITGSGLRGRGGAGFPTGLKWAKVRAADGGPEGEAGVAGGGAEQPDSVANKYVICNGDEGDPGAFMDRMLMESYPYRIIEGLAIAAYAVGASEGIFYIRAEYPLACERITAAIAECERRGLLRPAQVPGSAAEHSNVRAMTEPGLHLRVVQGAGAFVCGEETALIASLEGERGLPRLRPPYPAEEGLWGRPTLVNNVETLACVPWIIRNGAAEFAALGTERSKGTKVFALAGKVARGGLIEVPMGITIREIVEEIGGGVKQEVAAADEPQRAVVAGRRRHAWKAVQIGGPSGGCVPAALSDAAVDYEDLAELGAIMGSGGLVVLDESDCMVDIARYFLAFTQDQSCGKCTPCRVGTRRMLEILERICAGRGQPEDLARLEELAWGIQKTSLCGLGKTAPNPVLTTLRYFRDEYEAHLAGRCPAGKCRELIEYFVTDACTGCTLCAQHCPVGAIALRPYERHRIDVECCTRCDVCRARCPEAAIEIVSPPTAADRAAARSEPRNGAPHHEAPERHPAREGQPCRG